MAQLFALPYVPALSLQAQIMGASRLYFYLTETTTKATIYADPDLANTLPNPVVADAYGRFAPIYLDDSLTYRVRLTDINGAQIGTDIDGVNANAVALNGVIAGLANEIAGRMAVDAALDGRLTDAESDIGALQNSVASGILQYATWTEASAQFQPYASETTYSKGDSAVDQNTLWTYINDTASAGHTPPTLPATSDDYWQVLAANPYTITVQVPVTDDGTHTDPTDGTTDTPNSGVFRYTTGESGTGLKYIAPTTASQAKPYADLSKAWATSPDEPDPDNAPGEQSAKTYAGDAATSAASIDDRMAIYDALPEVDDASYVMVDGENNIVGSVSNEGELDFPIPSDNVPYLPAIFDTLDQALDDLTLVDDDDNIVGSNGGGSDDGEVVAARGIRTDLDSRLSESLTDYGQPRRGLYAPERLVTTRALIAQILAGDDVQLRIGWIGDSWTAFTSVGVHAYYMPIVGDRIAAITGMPLAAPGWIGFTKGGQDDSIGVVVGDWATDTSGGGKGPDTCKVTGTAAAGDFTVTGVPAGLSGIRLYHEGGGAEISYAWNGGDANSLTLTGAGETIVDLPAIDAGTLVISVTSGTAVLNGLSLDSTASGVVIDNLADSGSNLLQWVSVPESDWQAAITAGAYDLVVIGPFGTNDQPAYDAAAFKGYGQTLIDRVSAALPNADILLAASPENVAGRPRPMRDYQEALRQLAAVNACAMLDLQYYFRTSSDWLDETTVHPTRIGSAAVSEAFIRTLFCEV